MPIIFAVVIDEPEPEDGISLKSNQTLWFKSLDQEFFYLCVQHNFSQSFKKGEVFCAIFSEN